MSQSLLFVFFLMYFFACFFFSKAHFLTKSSTRKQICISDSESLLFICLFHGIISLYYSCNHNVFILEPCMWGWCMLGECVRPIRCVLSLTYDWSALTDRTIWLVETLNAFFPIEGQIWEIQWTIKWQPCWDNDGINDRKLEYKKSFVLLLYILLIMWIIKAFLNLQLKHFYQGCI